MVKNLLITFHALIMSMYISLVGRLFANGPGDRGSIPGFAIPKTLKLYLIPPCLTLSNTRYVSRVKWSNPRKGVARFPTPWCCSYWKGSLLVALDYGRQQLLHDFQHMRYYYQGIWIGLLISEKPNFHMVLYLSIAISRWDIITEVYRLISLFQRLSIQREESTVDWKYLFWQRSFR